MIYAGRHGYHELLDRAAPLVIAEPLKSTLDALPPTLVVPWVSGRFSVIICFSSLVNNRSIFTRLGARPCAESAPLKTPIVPGQMIRAPA